MRRVIEPLSRMGASFSGDSLPLAIHGTRALRGIYYTLPVASAQVKSAILLAGMHAHGETRVHEPAPTRNHTELALAQPSARLVRIPGDPSSAAYLSVAAMLTPGSDIEVRDLCLNPTRIAFASLLKCMGGRVSWRVTDEWNGEPVGNLRVRYSPELFKTFTPAPSIPLLIDEIPALSLVAAFAPGETVFQGAGELRVKESDRLAGIVRGFTALGLDARARGDDLVIVGRPELRTPRGLAFPSGARLESAGDHRMALLWQLAELCSSEPLCLSETACCAVSYPQFTAHLRALRQMP